MLVDIINAFAASGLVNFVVWACLLGYRKLAGLDMTFGTELFSLLILLDLGAIFQWYPVLDITTVRLSLTQVRAGAMVLIALVFLCATYCFPLEKRAQDARYELRKREIEDALAGKRVFPERASYLLVESGALFWVWLMRWLLVSAHTAWIIKAPLQLMVITR